MAALAPLRDFLFRHHALFSWERASLKECGLKRKRRELRFLPVDLGMAPLTAFVPTREMLLS